MRKLIVFLSVAGVMLGTMDRAYADCAAAPLATATDMVISMKTANGVQVAPGSQLSSTVKEGMVVYDDTANELKLCDGTNWVSVGSGGGGGATAAGAAGYLQLSDGSSGLTYSGTTAGQQLFWDNTNKRLGIGTATPAQPLVLGNTSQVTQAQFGGSNALYLMRSNPSVGFNAYWDGSQNVYGAGSSGQYAGRISFDSAVGKLNFATTSATGNAAATAAINTRMTIDKDGNVGINNTSPVNGLDVGSIAAKFGQLGMITNFPEIMFNGYYDVANTTKKYTAAASSFNIYHSQTADLLTIGYAADGTADSAVTYQPGFTLSSTGGVLVGPSTLDASAKLQVNSTAQGFLPPRMTTAQRTAIASPAEGLIVYDTDVDSLYIRANGAWVTVGSAAAGSDVSFRATSSVQSMTTATWTDIINPTQSYDNGGDNYNTTTGKYTVPSTGMYVFHASIYPGNGSGSSALIVQTNDAATNGTRICTNWSGIGGSVPSCSGSIYLTSGTVVEMVAYQSSGGTTAIPADGNVAFGGFKITGGSGGGGGSTTLAALTDVDVSTPPTDGQSLVYNSTSSKWVPGTVSGGGGTSPAFYVHKNGTAQTVVTDTMTKVTWVTERFDVGNYFDLTTNRFTPQVAGKYVISGSVYCDASGSYCQSAIYKNGTVHSTGFTRGGQQFAPVTAVIDMNGTTDYVELWGSAGSGTLFSGTLNYTYFSGSLIGGGSGGGSASAAGSTGAIQFNGGSSAFAADDTNFFWDDTAKALGIGGAPVAIEHMDDSPVSIAPSTVSYSSTSTDMDALTPGLTILNTDETTNNTAVLSFATNAGGNPKGGAAIAAQFRSRSSGVVDLMPVDLVFITGLANTASGGSSEERMRLTGLGELQVDGGLRLRESKADDTSWNAPCDAAHEGSIQYRTDDDKFQLCLTAGQPWVDLSTGGGSTTFPLLATPAGSTSAASYSFASDGNTGMFSNTADTVEFTAGGTQALELGTTASGVNYLRVTPGTATTSPTITNVGSSTFGGNGAALGINIQGRNSTATGDMDGRGGGVYISAGSTADTLDYNEVAPVVITGGASLDDSAYGGPVRIKGGTGSLYSGGHAYVAGGDGAYGGSVWLSGGTPTGGAGGTIFMNGANAVGTNQNGGNVILTAGNETGSGITGLVQIASGLKLTADVAPASLAASQNNYAPTNAGRNAVLRLTASTPVNITGLAGGTDGRIMILANIGTNAITLTDDDAASTAANRFALTGNLVLAADQTTTLIYDATSSRWRVMGADGAGSGGSASAADTTGAVQFNGGSSAFAGEAASFFWDSTNKYLGIGTNAPARPVHIVSPSASSSPGIRIDSTDTGGRSYEILSTASGSTAGVGKLLFRDVTGNNNAMVLDATGYLGIGTATPATELHVASATTFKPQLTIENTAADDKAGYLVFKKTRSGASPTASDGLGTLVWQAKDTGGTWRNTAYINGIAGTAGATFVPATIGFTTVDTAGTGGERMRISADGNVGIGTITPQTKLQLEGGSDVVLATAASGYLIMGATSGFNMALDNNEIMVRNNGSASPLFLQTDGGQVGVGMGGGQPHASALVDLTSTTQGFLPPRMTTAQRVAIASPAEGLTVYDTDLDELMVYTISAWAPAGGMVLLQTTTVSSAVATVSMTGIPLSNFQKLYVEVNGISFSSSTARALVLLLSSNNGTNWGTEVDISPTTSSGSDTVDSTFEIWNVNGPQIYHPVLYFSGLNGSGYAGAQTSVPVASAGAVNAIRLKHRSGGGNIDAGTIKIYGVR